MTTRIGLNWIPALEPDVAGYKVVWDTPEPGDKPKMLLLQKGTHNITLDVVLKRKTVYTFSVIVFDKAGNESEPKIIKAWYKE